MRNTEDLVKAEARITIGVGLVKTVSITNRITIRRVRGGIVKEEPCYDKTRVESWLKRRLNNRDVIWLK